MKDFLGRDIKKGDFFIQADKSGRSSVQLILAQCLGFKKTRMYYTRAYNMTQTVKGAWTIYGSQNYTTRYDAVFIIPEADVPYAAAFELKKFFILNASKYEDKYGV